MCGCVQEDEENGIGDVDLFTLSEDKGEVTVNAKWLQHLQVAPPSHYVGLVSCLHTLSKSLDQKSMGGVDWLLQY